MQGPGDVTSSGDITQSCTDTCQDLGKICVDGLSFAIDATYSSSVNFQSQPLDVGALTAVTYDSKSFYPAISTDSDNAPQLFLYDGSLTTHTMTCTGGSSVGSTASLDSYRLCAW